MKIRFFNTFDTTAPFFRTLLPYLVGQGHDVEAIFARQKYRPGALSAGDGAYRIRQVPSLAVPLPGGRGKKLSVAASYALSAASLSIGSRWPDVNVFLTQPPLFAAWARVPRALHGQRYCVVGMDLYPWVAIKAGALPRDGLRSRATESIALKTLRHAARVVVIGRCMAERVTGFGVAETRIRLITNWADTEVIRPVPRDANALRRRFGLDGKFVVMYSGNLGVSHYFDDLLEVARRLRRLPDIVVLFVGGGSRLAEVQRRSDELDLDNVRFLGYQDYELLSESLSMGDIHFVSLRNGFEGLVVPSKTYGALAAGRPVIYQGSRRGEIARTLEESGTGLIVDQGRADELEQAVLRAYDDPDWRLEAGRRARRTTVERFSPEPGLRAYGEMFRELETTEGTPS